MTNAAGSTPVKPRCQRNPLAIREEAKMLTSKDWNAIFSATRESKTAEFRRKRTATLIGLRKSFIMKGFGASKDPAQAAAVVAIADVLAERDALR